MNNLDKLKEYEKIGQYVFHGSGENIKEFEPRQAHNFVNGEKVPDGGPAVFASNVLDYAIFMAIINKKNLPQGSFSGVHINDKGVEFTASSKTIQSLHKDMSGYVYVFSKTMFKHKAGKEYTCFQNIKPLEKLEVKFSDFKHPIKVKEEHEM